MARCLNRCLDADDHVVECERTLVTRDGLARALHSGCALTRVKHPFDECGNADHLRMHAKRLIDAMEAEG